MLKKRHAALAISVLLLGGCAEMSFDGLKKIMPFEEKNDKANSNMDAMGSNETGVIPLQWDNGSALFEERESAGVQIPASNEYALVTPQKYAPVEPLQKAVSGNADFNLPKFSKAGAATMQKKDDAPKEVWAIKEGEYVCDTVEKWSFISGEKAFCRDTGGDWLIDLNDTYSGTFYEAVEWLLAGFKTSQDYRPKAIKHENAIEIYAVSTQ